MTERKTSEPQPSPNPTHDTGSSTSVSASASTQSHTIWDCEEWPSSAQPHTTTAESGDSWDDGTEWPSQTHTVSQETVPAPDMAVTPPIPNAKEEHPSSVSEPSIPQVISTEATESAVPTESAVFNEATEAIESAASTEPVESIESPKQTDSVDSGGDAFVVDGVRNDQAWGKSDQDWQEVAWVESPESQKSEESVPSEVSVHETTPASKSESEPKSHTSALPSSGFVVPSGYNAGPQPTWISSLEGTRGYVIVFLFALLTYGTIFGQRLGQVSSDPHYTFLADALLKGRWFLDRYPQHPITQHRMDNDWAYMDQILVSRLQGKPLSKVTLLRGQWKGPNHQQQVFATLKHRWTIHKSDVRYNRRYYFVSFPPLPAFLMMPAVWLVGTLGYDRLRFSDITFSLFFAALAVLLLFVLLQRLSQSGKSHRNLYENLQLTLLFAVGSVFFFVATQGTVWFTALTVGTCCSFAFLIAAEDARYPVLAGIFVAMGFLTRPLLLLLGAFFVWQLIRQNHRWVSPFSKERFRTLVLFALPIVLTVSGMMFWNHHRFGNPMEFGHSFLPAVFWRVESYGLFHPHWIGRNLYAFFLALPEFKNILPAFDFSRYPQLVIRELPLLPTFFVPVLAVVQKIAAPLLVALAAGATWRAWELRREPHRTDLLFWLLAGGFLGLLSLFLALRMLPFPRINAHGLSLFITTPALVYLFFQRHRHPWFWGLVLTVVVILLPQLLYQNTGWLTFGNRFSLDYMPLLMVLLALSGVVFGRLWKWLLLCAVAINTLGAVSFGRAWYLYNTKFESLDWIFRFFS